LSFPFVLNVCYLSDDKGGEERGKRRRKKEEKWRNEGGIDFDTPRFDSIPAPVVTNQYFRILIII